MWRSRVSPVADGREAGVPDPPRRATHGLADAPRTPAIPKEPEESGPMVLIAMSTRDSIGRSRPHPLLEQLRTVVVAQRRGPGVQGIGS